MIRKLEPRKRVAKKAKRGTKKKARAASPPRGSRPAKSTRNRGKSKNAAKSRKRVKRARIKPTVRPKRIFPYPLVSEVAKPQVAQPAAAQPPVDPVRQAWKANRTAEVARGRAKAKRKMANLPKVGGLVSVAPLRRRAFQAVRPDFKLWELERKGRVD